MAQVPGARPDAPGDSRPSGVSLAQVLGTISMAVDLGIGQQMGHVARSCLLAQRLGDLAGLSREERTHLFHVTLMGWVGCIADSHQAAAWFGDDIDYRAGVYDLDMRPLPFLGYMLRRVGPEDPLPVRTGKATLLVASGGRGAQESLQKHCQVTEHVAVQFGLPASVCTALRQVFARWDGHGMPKGLGGEDVALAIRLWQLCDVVEVHHSRGGPAAATRVARSRSGSQFDPGLVDLFCAHVSDVLAPLEGSPDTAFEEVVAADPTLGIALTHDEFDRALAIAGDWIDLKSPCFAGHSRAVADLAGDAARARGLGEDEIRLVRRAGSVHDLGRAGVPNTVWDKTDPLTAVERERVRLHSYYTDRMLAATPALAQIGAVAGAAHERLDGSGYHRGRSAPDLPATARILAAADCYRTSLEDRPHRPARSSAQAAAALRREASEGRLDAAAVDAVLATAGQRPTRAPAGPAGLTARETEVLTLLARGLTNRQIARRLGISAKTAGNHVEHIYTKAQVRNRSAATMFAMRNGLT